jgi:hypothetical protein
MAKYLYRSCPRCNGYVGIVMRQPERDMPLQAVNGRCVRCRYRFAWIVIRGGRSSGSVKARQRLRLHAQENF